MAWLGESTLIKMIKNLSDQNIKEKQENSKNWTWKSEQ